MTVLRLQLSPETGFLLTTPESARRHTVNLLEGELKVSPQSVMIGDVKLASVKNHQVFLNQSVLKKAVGDISGIVQQLRYFVRAMA